MILYRAYDSAGRLLYIGITGDPLARMKEHQVSSPWADDMTRLRIVAYPDERSAREAERQAIRAEGPLWNVRDPRHRPDWQRTALSSRRRLRYDQPSIREAWLRGRARAQRLRDIIAEAEGASDLRHGQESHRLRPRRPGRVRIRPTDTTRQVTASKTRAPGRSAWSNLPPIDRK